MLHFEPLILIQVASLGLCYLISAMHNVLVERMYRVTYLLWPSNLVYNIKMDLPGLECIRCMMFLLPFSNNTPIDFGILVYSLYG